MAMAEVATPNPPQTSATGPTIAASTSSPTLLHSSFSAPLAQQFQPSQKQQRPAQGTLGHSVAALQPFSPSSSPTGSGDGSTASTFPPHWTQSGQMQFSTPDGAVSRGLPPIVSSPMIGIPQTSQDIRQPVSPRTVPPVINDTGHDLMAFSSDLTAPRKRSKVSRACDECRRKKVLLSTGDCFITPLLLIITTCTVIITLTFTITIILLLFIFPEFQLTDIDPMRCNVGSQY